jgi:hypothetical protein
MSQVQIISQNEYYVEIYTFILIYNLSRLCFFKFVCESNRQIFITAMELNYCIVRQPT